MTEAMVEALGQGGTSPEFTAREKLALQFAELMAVNHKQIDDDFFAALKQELVVFQKWRWPLYTARPKAYRLTNKPMTMSCICVDFEKQMVLRTKRLMRVRSVRCFRSIFWVCRLPGQCTSGARC